tara:strand:+ start:125 stop:1024 length:900 start_codon:yes stop_codon:yes gene_type:complete
MTIQTVTTDDSIEVWTEKTNTISQSIGELSELTSTDKTSIINSVNELLTTLNTNIDNVVEDTTPELGGNLNLNSNDITGTGNINITGSYAGSISSTSTATTPLTSDSSTKIATTAYTDVKISSLLGSIVYVGDVTGQTTSLQIGANKVGTNELSSTESGQEQFIKTDGSGILSFINTTETGGNAGGDLSGQVTSLQLNSNVVNVNELNLVEGSDGYLMTTNGSNGATFRPSVILSKVLATLNQTTFSINYIVGNIVVYLSGIKLVNGEDFTATNGTSVVLTTSIPSSGLYVEFQRYGVS